MLRQIIFFAAALLTGLGIGSGGLLIYYLTEWVGLSQLSAGSVNLIFFIAAAAVSTVINFIKKRILKKELLVLSLSGAAGAVIGSLIASDFSDGLLKKLFGALLIVMGAIMLFSAKKK
ncbi:MAG: TSUP family transporter [Firmicutes bacterium]|nr:TSUP family transporter [Bacillota bacterium]